MKWEVKEEEVRTSRPASTVITSEQCMVFACFSLLLQEGAHFEERPQAVFKNVDIDFFCVLLSLKLRVRFKNSQKVIQTA